jgi:hypothetical protein
MICNTRWIVRWFDCDCHYKRILPEWRKAALLVATLKAFGFQQVRLVARVRAVGVR